MAVDRFVPPIYVPEGSVGEALPGAKLYFYANGSSSTLQDTYSDLLLTIPNTNPVVADGNGRFAQIFGNSTYSVKMTNSAGTTIWGPHDDIVISVDGSINITDASNSSSTNVLTITHQTTGVPAAGIGTALAFKTETASGNLEVGMILESRSSDVTAASEDFSFFVKLMAAGAAAVDVLEITSLKAMNLLGAINTLRVTVVSHATTSAIWAAVGNEINLTGAETITDFPAAPQIGASRILYPAAGVIITHAGNITVQGNANRTAAAGEKWTIHAVTTTTFKVFIEKQDGLPTITGNLTGHVTSTGLAAVLGSFTLAQLNTAISDADLTAGGFSVIRSARTSNTILGVADSGALIDFTSGTFSQTFTAAATLGSGWFCYAKASGTGYITLEPDGAELIDSLTNFIMYPGEVRLIQCTGTAFTSVVLTPFRTTFASSVTFTKPPGYGAFGIDETGGGGGGGSGMVSDTASERSGGGGGGAGARAEAIIQAISVGTTESISIGAGGTGGAGQTSDGAVGNVGVVGGNTSFGTHLLAKGGNFGAAGASATTVAGGAASAGYPTDAVAGSGSNDGPAGGTGSSTTGNAGAGVTGKFIPTGGGGGGGAGVGVTTNVAGGTGGVKTAATTTSGYGVTVAASAGGTSGGVAAEVGTASLAGSGIGGTGGGGGFYRTGVNSGAGAAGGLPGGGGGGSGAADNGFDTLAGGAGADGSCTVMGIV